MRKTFTATTDGPTSVVVDLLADLSHYPAWLDVVSEASPAEPIEADEGRPAWWVTLTAKVGPFARSKRLRMVRTGFDEAAEPVTIHFERGELDGRDHAPWVMEASIDSKTEDAVLSTVSLYYGGSLWTGPLEVVLDAAATKAASRLKAQVAAENQRRSG